MQNFVFLKMSDKSEHSNSRFYYPGKMSNTELLQLPTYCTLEVQKEFNALHESRSSELCQKPTTSKHHKEKNLSGWTVQQWAFGQNKQTVLRRNFFQRRASKNSSYARKHHKENKGHHTVHPYNKTCLFLLAYKFHQQGQQT